MQTDNRLLDDLARVISGAMGATAGIRSDLEARMREPLERWAQRMDLVGREEFEVMREMLVAAREAQESLTQRVAELEAEVASLKSGTRAKTRK